MRPAFAALALILVILSGSAAAADKAVDASADDSATLVIDAGRLAVMMDQSQAALKLLDAGDAHGDLAAAAQRVYAFQQLVAAVLEYNLLVQKACRAGVVAAKHCTGPFLPPWLSAPPGTDPGAADLRRMVDAAGARLIPFWDDVCPRGRAAAHDDSFCGIE